MSSFLEDGKSGYFIPILILYYIPINDTTFDLSVFWPSDTESRINQLRLSDPISLSFKTRLTLVTYFVVTLGKISSMDSEMKNMMTLRQETEREGKRSSIFSRLKTNTMYKIRKNVSKRYIINILL